MKQSEAARSEQTLFSVRGIVKSFGSNAVLKGIDLSVGEGEVLALIGGNGAGKSTLMKIIMGIYQPDAGNVTVAGDMLSVFKPSVALSKGIYMVPQEPMLFPNMTVEENILIGFSENTAVLRKRLLNIMDEIGWHLDTDRKAMSLSIAEQQLVELLRGLLRQAKLLILDEPTSALTFDEVESLFRIVEDLKKKGIGIIYITHRLAEVFQIATHVAIMRDGVITLKGKTSDFTREMLVKGLLPPNMDGQQRAGEKESGYLDYSALEPVFELKGYSGYGFRDINLKIYPGEILGVAGVVGAGRTELAVTIFGKDKVLGGKAFLDGKDVTGLSTREVLKSGINYVPEDRRLNGLFGISDVAANITSALVPGKSLGRIFLNRKAEQLITRKYVEDFRIKITGQDQIAGSLSGGNQQKIVIGRSLSTDPKLVILDEPTRGIDAAARGDVYAIIHELKKQGVAVMLISSDMEEIVELSDRAVVVFQGRLRGELGKHEISQASLMAASFGVTEGKQVEA
ncbi:sugar ABC transporter ATP-binding protein [Lacrimispora sp.]|uniref:sugar ABC transporter ATP-binding protein n=1 Tax=Lacrimispora sp. TaxID=2719234 RepID=UPI0028AB4B79|nr:sugar ABC transporter ATP-binding protein [Lacrimispora sp.]